MLWIRIDRMGDLLVSTPLLAAMRAAHPQARQHVLASPINRTVADRQPESERVWVFPRRNPWRMLRLLRDIRRERYDWVIALNESWSRSTLMLTRFSGGSVLWGASLPNHANRVRPMLDRLVELPRRLHQVENLRLWAGALGLGLEDTVPRFPMKESETREARDALSALRIGPKESRPRPLVGLLMGNRKGAATNLYPGDRAMELINRTRDRYDWLLLWGSAAEREAAREVARAAPDAFLLPPADIPRLAAWIAQLDAVVCSCTGPLHLAQAVRTPAVALCRRFTYEVWRPLESPHRSLCGAVGERLDEITPDRIDEALRAMLGR